jgi:ABC-2 type transport system ATP-binding protein
MTDAVVLQGLSKSYGAIKAVDGIDLTVPTGMVYGFLGPNGAGKTTTLRMLLGLVRPSAGSISVLGAPPGSAHARARIGALIEGPALYPYLSGRDNLRVLAMYGDLPPATVDQALDLVALSSRAGDRYSTYSLGMKQRLGVAAALLKDPELVVLDEPTNGLDPAGIRDMRALVRQLGASGRTVLLSSHLMAEVQQICDRVAVIDRGRILAESSVEELRGHGELVVAATPSDVACDVIARHPDVTSVTVREGRLHVDVDPRHVPEIARSLVDAGVALSELRRDERQLEDVFIEMTHHQTEEVHRV